MRPSWLVGIITLYIILFALQMLVTAESPSSTTTGAELYDIPIPNSMVEKKLDTGDSIIGAKPEISAAVIMQVGEMAMLKFPGLFTGNYVWVWWILCFPIAMAFWITIFLAVVRGVSSG